jgi:hypothetical protein
VGIGTDTPSDYYTNWNNLVVGDGAGDEGITIATGTTSRGTLAFADGTSGDQGYRGFLQYDHLTDNLIVGTSGTTAMTIDSNKNVGIGVVPDAWDSSYTSLDIGTSGSLTSHNSNYTYLSNNGFVDGTSGVWEYKNTDGASLLKMSDNGSMEFNVAPSGTADAAISWTTAMTIDNSGGISKDGSFDGTGSSDDFYWNTGGGDRFRFHSGTTSSRDLLGFSNPNGVVGKIETVGSGTLYNTGNGGGIDFSGNAGTTATGATTTSQLLDDYEEGTWTPTLPNGGTVAGIDNALYTKIGRVVSWYFYITVNSIPSNTTAFRIGGLPYTVNTNSIYMGGTIGYVGTLNIETYGLMVLTLSNNDQIYFHRQDGSGSSATNSMFSSATTLLVSGQYYV